MTTIRLEGFGGAWPRYPADDGGLEELRAGGMVWLAVVDALAMAMLNSAIAGQQRAVGHYMRAAVTLPGDWRQRMACRWIDTFLDALGFTADLAPDGKPRRGRDVEVVPTTPDGVAVDLAGADALSRWTARLVSARAVLDEQGWRDLLDAPPAGASPDEQIMSVLHAVMQNLQHHPALGGESA